MMNDKPKTMLANILDHLFRCMIACCAGICWFVYLWGLRLTALTAGLALGGLIWLLLRQFVNMITRKREQQIRRMIGGEMALNRLLLLPPRHAGFQAALWLMPRYPIVMQKAVDWGITGLLNGKEVLVRVLAQHNSLPVSAQQIVETVRELRKLQIKHCLLCLTSAVQQEAVAYAAQAEEEITLIQRQELIELAGLCHPATTEELHSLAAGKKKIRRSKREWLRQILNPSNARKYLCYGITFVILALVTGQAYYPLPAIACLALYVLCKLHISIPSRTGI